MEACIPACLLFDRATSNCNEKTVGSTKKKSKVNPNILRYYINVVIIVFFRTIFTVHHSFRWFWSVEDIFESAIGNTSGNKSTLIDVNWPNEDIKTFYESLERFNRSNDAPRRSSIETVAAACCVFRLVNRSNRFNRNWLTTCKWKETLIDMFTTIQWYFNAHFFAHKQ